MSVKYKHFIILFLGITMPSCYGQKPIDSLIQVLESTIGQKALFDKQYEQKITFFKEQLASTTDYKEMYTLNKEIYQLYRFYNFDQALLSIEKNAELAACLQSDFYIQETTLNLCLLLSKSGRYKESIDELDALDPAYLDKKLLTTYYEAYRDAYSGLSYTTVVKKNKEAYQQIYAAYKDSLYSRLDINSESFLRLSENELKEANSLTDALKINSKRIEKALEGSRLYSLITFERSLIYGLSDDVQNRKKFLILSAISDIKASVKDNASIGELAKILFLEGDIDRAHTFINASYDDARLYNSPLRAINIANSLPLITKVYNEQRSAQKKRLKNSLIFISFLSAFLLITIYLVVKQVKRVSRARNELKNANNKLQTLNLKLNNSNDDLKQLYHTLSESDRIKEQYIGTFLNLYSEYIDKLDVYRKLVRKYIRANRLNTLFELSKSKKVIDEELEIFHKNFDTSFLHMHPDFLDSVNSLLKPSQQIVLSDPTRLDTELRILALIKLGITTSAGISKILRYSVNTIYNYRAAINGKALDKKNFENAIKNMK